MALFMEPAIVTREIYVQPITSGKVMNVRVRKHFDLLLTALTFLRINENYALIVIIYLFPNIFIS